jgi:hypothetical protein
MLCDPAVDGLFHHWAWPTGIRDALTRLAALPSQELVVALEAEALERVIAPHRRRLAQEARTFVREHMARLPWDFLARDLLASFECELVAAAFGVEVVQEFEVTAAAQDFDVPLGATIEQLFSRLKAAAARRPADRGRMPKGHGAALKEGARWLYRVRVRGEKPEVIAREYTAARRRTVSIAERNASTVVERIRRAEWALGLLVRVRNS